MTVVAAWVRAVADGCEELVVASDSRLSGGGDLDCCPKILTLPRSDTVIAFAGDTYFAYPLILQFAKAIDCHKPLRDRAMDYSKMRTHALRVFNHMVASFHDYAEGEQHPKTWFVLAGYSWVRKSFMIDLIHYKEGEKRFAYRPVPSGTYRTPRFVFAGDMARLARKSLFQMLRERYGWTPQLGSAPPLDWEPFEIVRDMLRNAPRQSSIGGAPQLVKVYEYLNTQEFGVYWPNRSSGKLFIGGRPLLGYESVDFWILDPDKLRSEHPAYSPRRT
jgi:hypothetical protein